MRMTILPSIWTKGNVWAVIRTHARSRTVLAAKVGRTISHFDCVRIERYVTGMSFKTIKRAGSGVFGRSIRARFAGEVGKFQWITASRDGVWRWVVHIAIGIAREVHANDFQ